MFVAPKDWKELIAFIITYMVVNATPYSFFLDKYKTQQKKVLNHSLEALSLSLFLTLSIYFFLSIQFATYVLDLHLVGALIAALIVSLLFWYVSFFLFALFIKRPLDKKLKRALIFIFFVLPFAIRYAYTI